MCVWGDTHVMHGRSRMTKDPRIPTMPGPVTMVATARCDAARSALTEDGEKVPFLGSQLARSNQLANTYIYLRQSSNRGIYDITTHS